ncbi:hypothetical protein [Variovorax rhizosphaerae]|uniref:Zinc ribbon domain-containing protein n=1 Tax=Variovorax rhizosphaerae TaxID=1836200 RepID=A0ABU8WHN7_9BURK
MTTACGICGKLNRKNARFCVGCAARLGIEPVGHSIPGPAFADSRRDASFDATRTGHSRSMPLRASAPAREPAMFWLRAGIAGLVLLIGFVGWCMYVLTSHKAVAPLQAGTNASVPAVQAESPSDPAATAVAPVTPAPLAPSTLAGSAAPASSNRAPTAAPLAPIAKPYAATGTEADASIAATPSSAANSAPIRSTATPGATPRNYARERNRRQESPDTETSSLPSNYSWVEPARQPANTLNPGYVDAGPPVVPGPGPRYASSIPSPVGVSPNYESTAPMRGPDAGPPIVPGPGPRYDFSSPGAIPR